MKHWLLLLALLMPIPGRTQALPAGTGPGAYTTVGVSGSIFQSDYGKLHLVGPGVYVEAHVHRYVGIVGEARFLRYNGQNGVTQDTYLVGPRYSFKPSHWVPYIKFPVGVAHMRFPYGYATGNYFVMAPGAGVEYWLTDRVRLRVVDAEYQLWPQFTFGTLHPYGATAGISFRVF